MLYLDYGFKIQILLTDFINIMWWQSILDILLFVFAFAAFCSSPKEAVGIFSFICHPMRAALGIVIVVKAPKTSQIMDEISKKFNANLQDSV